MRTQRGPTAAARLLTHVGRAAAVGPRSDAAYVRTSPLIRPQSNCKYFYLSAHITRNRPDIRNRACAHSVNLRQLLASRGVFHLPFVNYSACALVARTKKKKKECACAAHAQCINER